MSKCELINAGTDKRCLDTDDESKFRESAVSRFWSIHKRHMATNNVKPDETIVEAVTPRTDHR